MTSKVKIKKAMILCAGLGTRLLPITERIPKPLVPVLNIPNIVHTLAFLKRAGVTDVIINVFHLPKVMDHFLKHGERLGIKIQCSKEEVLLGTGGGLKKAEPFFKGEPFLLCNCDFLTDVDLNPLIEKHFSRKALATMVLLKNDTVQGNYSKVGIDGAGRLVLLPSAETGKPANTGIFTGIHILDSAVFSYLKEEPSGINHVLYPKLMQEHPDRAFGDFMKRGYWYDTGNVDLFWSASLNLLHQLENSSSPLKELLKSAGHFEERKPGVWIPHGDAVPDSVELVAPVVIGKQCRLGESSVIGPYSVIGENSEIGEKSQVVRTVAFDGARVPSERLVDSAIYFHQTAIPSKKPF